jgi:hypothetical protein
MKDRVLLTTNGTYPWSFVTQIFRNGLQSNGGDRKTTDVAFIDRSSTAGVGNFTFVLEYELCSL